uniref:Uncharacterized protein n=1 Tax=Entomoneis paludosa TaxID=265537 RepID=A0A6U3B267_9STRA|mmetsp:Transcript_28457/g.59410  ORF Transcript_28457/g.59410 Transcript_28457/m.59410 type:complete len:191 (+) Transcript_28457:489-1061(+)|eukprot:CAMPEP_0172463902 /NCGR_PEP_ID=MMETSP1065-20121228/48815_1 /TAXON_ID=265537 /ORGANISM="Amphiprora paludosa, Strain CCMP125" /LENGTH=190 /DNA_ID=CAMNT_0013219979 /DNA_START=427 /DNA_END=999 /DNA_ORIENTATION=+
MSQAPLLDQDATDIPLYDPQAMLVLDKAMAQGFLTLLSGGDPQPLVNLKRNRIRRSAVDMGFLALTEGNVLEACFGLPASSVIIRDGHQLAPKSTTKSKRATAHVRRAKQLLEQASDENEAICKMAVGTYLKAFEIVINTRDQMDQLNLWTRCFFYRRVSREAQVELRATFARLQEAILVALSATEALSE